MLTKLQEKRLGINCAYKKRDWGSLASVYDSAFGRTKTLRMLEH